MGKTGEKEQGKKWGKKILKFFMFGGWMLQVIAFLVVYITIAALSQ